MNFKSEWLETWCELYQRLSVDYCRGLYNAISRSGIEPEETNECISHPELVAKRILEVLKRRNPTQNELILGRTCLIEFDQRYGADASCHRRFQSPPELFPNDEAHRYILIDGGPSIFWQAIKKKGRFRLDSEFGLSPMLPLKYHWSLVPLEVDIAFSSGAELNPLRASTSMRIALVPFTNRAEQNWDRGNCGTRTTVFCHGARDAQAAWENVQSILDRARDRRVTILIFPELSVDEELLDKIRRWLAQNNLEDPIIRILVAGTRHLLLDDGTFVNRATILGFEGSILWEQDKRTPFRLERADLPGFFDGCSADYAEEPSCLGKSVVVRQTPLGSVMTPICIDFFNDDIWMNLRGHLYFVPAMTRGLSRFKKRAEQIGGINGAVTLLCNAQDGNQGHYVYIPTIKLADCQEECSFLFTFDLNYVITNVN